MENVSSKKLLGVIIDKHLAWKNHVDNIASSLSKKIALLRRIKNYLPINIRLLYYKVFFQSTVGYCNIIWGQSSHITRIHKLQKIALRVIYDKSRYTSSDPLFQESYILPIDYRVKYRITITTCKAINGLAPNYICEMFRPLSSVSKRTTRSTIRNDLWTPNFKLNVTRKSLSYSGAVIYNSLPEDIRNAQTISIFKRDIFRYLLDMSN